MVYDENEGILVKEEKDVGTVLHQADTPIFEEPGSKDAYGNPIIGDAPVGQGTWDKLQGRQESYQ